MNTNFNNQIKIYPENLSAEEFGQLRKQLRPTPIGIIEEIDEDGVVIDIIGRFISVNGLNEF